MSGNRVVFRARSWWLAAFLAVVALQIVASNWIANVWDFGPAIPVIEANGIAVLLDVAVIGLVWGVLQIEGVTFAEIGLSRKLVIPAILAVGSFYLVLNALAIGLGVLLVGFSIAGYQWVVPPAMAAAEFVYALIVAAIVEELVYRGYVQSKVIAVLGGDTRTTVTVSIITASVLFVLSHGPRVLLSGIPGQQSLLAYAGILFLSAVGYGIIFELTHNLYIPILIHAAGNMPGTIGIVFFDLGAFPGWTQSLYPLIYLALFTVVVVVYRWLAPSSGWMPVWTERVDSQASTG